MRARTVIIAASLFLVGAGCAPRQAAPTLTPSTPTAAPTHAAPEIVAANLSVPWDLAFLPDGRLLVTERGGTLRIINPGETDRAKDVVIQVADVRPKEEGGLLGVVLHPQFAENHFVYLCLTTVGGNHVDRYVLEKDALTHRATILDGIPSGIYHDGGRLAFGPDGKLYVTAGEGGSSARAQDAKSLGGKILRINDDGTIPSDNPFGNAVWAMGLRNPQGLAWDADGRMWATDHGRSGVQTGLDEINLIEKGKNYGWPTIQGDATQVGLVTPYVNSGPTTTWAPSGLERVGTSLFFGGLKGESLYELKLNDTSRKVIAHFKGDYGRLRAVHLGPDGMLYVTTSNRDGRGSPVASDDRIIKIDPATL